MRNQSSGGYIILSWRGGCFSKVKKNSDSHRVVAKKRTISVAKFVMLI